MKKNLACILIAVLLVTSVVPTMKAEAAMTAEQWYNSTMASMRAKVVNGVDGNDILYSPTWYSGLSEVEVLARLIYAEAPWWIRDKKCVALVLWNRTKKSGYGGNTVYQVAVAPGHFTTITGDRNTTEGARTVNIETASWQSALRYACIIYVSGTANPKATLGSDIGDFSDQTNFRSYGSFSEKAYDSLGSSFITIEETIYRIHNIYIPMHGYVTNVVNAHIKYNDPTNAANGLPYDANGERVNIYFSTSNY